MFALLRGYIPFLHFEVFWGEWDALYFLSFFSFLSGGYLVPLILLSDTCLFLPLVSLFLFFEVPGTCPFLFPRIHFFFSFSLFFLIRALISRNNIASGSNQDNLSIYFTGEKYKCFWLFSPGLGVEYFYVILVMEMSGYMWMRTSGVEAACMSERASESWFNHMTSS